MFVSFFPKPKLFFISAVAWSLAAVFFWYLIGEQMGASFGMPPAAADAPPVIGAAVFWTKPYIWFYIYFWVVMLVFYAFWRVFSPSKWQSWSVLGSAFLIFTTNFSVQVSVAINEWRGPFFDMVQRALAKPYAVTQGELYKGLWDFATIAFVFMAVFVVTRFFVSHWIFRWRTAMNDYYMSHWSRVRTVEGASQRVQEDTMRFSDTVEGLGISLVDAVMTLIAFLPLLAALSSRITAMPLIGSVPYSLVWAAILWSIFGTALLAVVGVKLPGLHFRNQRVEAAYRKELVYGEDDAARATPPTVAELFANVRSNYFRMYFHYAYFNVARSFYIQADNIFAYILLVPTIAAGAITFGVMQQILTAFGQVSSSFQYLVNSWPTIVELLSIHKRLKTFEAAISGEALPEIDQRYLERKAEGADEAEIAT